MNSEPNIVVQLLEGMSGAKWLIFGVALLTLEVVTGTTYILWPAVAALIVGILVFVLPLGWEMQFLLFFLISTILLFVGHKYFRPMMKGGEPSDLNDRATSMIGMRVKAVTDFETGRGRVQVGDTQWQAMMNEGDAKEGDELRVVAVKGATLQVVEL
jgi:membrane protein implicated in regulation of membrane protease activity